MIKMKKIAIIFIFLPFVLSFTSAFRTKHSVTLTKQWRKARKSAIYAFNPSDLLDGVAWSKAIDASLLGLILRQASMPDLPPLPPLPPLPSLPPLPPLSSLSSLPSLPPLSIRFPAAEQEIKDASAFLSTVDWNNLGPITQGINYLSGFIDLLPVNEEMKLLLSSQPPVLRAGLALVLFELIPLFLNILLVEFLWKNVIAVKPESIDTSSLPRYYDKEMISTFYKKKPQIVLGRLSELGSLCIPLFKGLVSDALQSSTSPASLLQAQENERERAVQLRELVAACGPVFIKVAQAISVRPDILSVTYREELQKLQENVPPFPSEVARNILLKELEVSDLDEVFVDSATSFRKPIAAASLGQVYKATLVDSGKQVAVKIQRPNMLYAVTLDLYIIRLLLKAGMRVPKIREECKSMITVVDVWAGRFIDELDYTKEMDNSLRFKSQIEEAEDNTLSSTIVVPEPILQLCSLNVLVTEFIQGTKLNSIDTTTEKGKQTVKNLTRVLLNSYLMQLLQTGLLHSDPHPGNFLVTSTGKLCILDFGLMTEVEEEKRYALVDYISHLLAKDYDATLEDLVILGFIPSDVTATEEKRKIVGPILAQVLEKLSNGGGASSFNVNDVGNQLEILSKQYPLIIPAYFGLIFRAFGSLEGIGLSVDLNYSIVKECFPYLASRLLSDDSPRIRQALKVFLFGRNRDHIDPQRLEDLAEGFATFARLERDATTGKVFQELSLPIATNVNSKGNSIPSAAVGGGGGGGAVGAVGRGGGVSQQAWIANFSPARMNAASPTSIEAVEIEPAIQQALNIILTTKEQGNFVQDLLIEETARLIDALTRSLLYTGTSFVTENGLLPPLPFNGNRYLSKLTALNQDDLDALRTLKKLLQILSGLPSTPSSSSSSSSSSSLSQGRLDRDDIILVQAVLQSLRKLIPSDANNNNQDSSLFSRAAQLQYLASQLQVLLPGALKLGSRLGQRVGARMLERAAVALETKD